MLAGLSFIYVPLLGGVFTLLTGLLDTLDGSLARATGQSKKFGAFLDSVLDRYTELMIYLGIWVYFYHTPFYLLLILLILFGSLMVSYTGLEPKDWVKDAWWDSSREERGSYCWELPGSSTRS